MRRRWRDYQYRLNRVEQNALHDRAQPPCSRFTLLRLLAIAPSASSGRVRSTPSISNSRGYCLTRAFLGSVRMRLSAASSRSEFMGLAARCRVPRAIVARPQLMAIGAAARCWASPTSARAGRANLQQFSSAGSTHHVWRPAIGYPRLSDYVAAGGLISDRANPSDFAKPAPHLDRTWKTQAPVRTFTAPP